MPPFEQLEWTQYLVKIPTFRLEQLILNPTLPVNIHVATKQIVYGNVISFCQPKRVNPHSQPNGKLPRDSLGGGSHN